MEVLVDGIMEVEMVIRRRRMRLEVALKTRGEIIPIISMIRTIEIREEEVKDKDLEEEAFVGNVFTLKKKGMKHLSVPSANER